MTAQRAAAGGVLLWLALLVAVGPAALLAALLLLAPPVRSAVRSLHPLRLLLVVPGLGVALVAAVLVLPTGTLPIPSGPGLLVTPRTVGGPSNVGPLTPVPVPPHPHLADNGRSNMHNDPYATDAYTWAGPTGDDLEVDTAWFGVEECATLAFDSRDRIVALCGDVSGPTLRVLDPETMRPLATEDLPDRPESDVPPWQNLCAGAYFYLDADDRAVLATTDQRILVFDTSTDAGEPTLAQAETHELADTLPDDACLLALMPDWDGNIWFVAGRDGGQGEALVGFVDPASGEAATRNLGEVVANSFSVDEDGGVYVVSDHAQYRFEARDGRPVEVWRAPYDRGSTRRPGALSQGSGTTPTLLEGPDGPVVALTDNAEPQMNLLLLDRATGEETCRIPVLEPGESTTENSLVAVGDLVIVENNHGYEGPWTTMFGRTSAPGIAAVDVTTCEVAWTSDEVAPTSVPKASAGSGLLYVYTTRSSRWGVTAWYLTAIDLRTGETAWSRRTGLGPLLNNHYAAVTLAPDGAAYIATLAGMVRVRDGS